MSVAGAAAGVADVLVALFVVRHADAPFAKVTVLAVTHEGRHARPVIAGGLDLVGPGA